MGRANEDLREELAAHGFGPPERCLGELRGLCDALGARERPGDRMALTLRDVRTARRLTGLLHAVDRHVRVFVLRRGGATARGGGSVIRLTWMVPVSGPGGGRAGLTRRVAWFRGYLAGTLLVAGYLADPLRGYSLEWSASRQVAAGRLEAGLARSLSRLGVPFRSAPGRRGGTRVYVKGGDAVGLVLRHVDAMDSVFTLEDARSMRSMRGQVHRAVNGEMANLARSARAGAVQAELARHVLASGRAGDLPPAVWEVARIRAARPEASLGELGEELGIARSSVHGRLRRLAAWARSQGIAVDATRKDANGTA